MTTIEAEIEATDEFKATEVLRLYFDKDADIQEFVKDLQQDMHDSNSQFYKDVEESLEYWESQIPPPRE